MEYYAASMKSAATWMEETPLLRIVNGVERSRTSSWPALEWLLRVRWEGRGLLRRVTNQTFLERFPGDFSFIANGIGIFIQKREQYERRDCPCVGKVGESERSLFCYPPVRWCFSGTIFLVGFLWLRGRKDVGPPGVCQAFHTESAHGKSHLCSTPVLKRITGWASHWPLKTLSLH